MATSQEPILSLLHSLKNLSFKCSPGFSPPPIDLVAGPFFSGKRTRTNRNSLQRKGFPICPYYTIRAYLRQHRYHKRCWRCQRIREAGPQRQGCHPPHVHACRPRKYEASQPDFQRCSEKSWSGVVWINPLKPVGMGFCMGFSLGSFFAKQK